MFSMGRVGTSSARWMHFVVLNSYAIVKVCSFSAAGWIWARLGNSMGLILDARRTILWKGLKFAAVGCSPTHSLFGLRASSCWRLAGSHQPDFNSERSNDDIQT